MKAYVIKNKDFYVKSGGRTKNINRALVYFSKALAIADSFPKKGETIVQVDVQIKETKQ